MSNQETRLYSGPDLENAARLSPRGVPGARLSGMTNAAGLMLGRAASRFGKTGNEPIRAARAYVHVPGTTETLVAVYIGRGENRAWLTSTLFQLQSEDSAVLSDYGGSLAEQITGLAAGADVLFIEDVPKNTLADTGIDFITMPAWVKQRVPILPDWQQQLDSMRRSTRREVARLLRKFQFTCRISRDVDDFTAFYDDLYVPYITTRHRDAAEIVPRDLFINECEKGVVLQLADGDQVVGSSLARPTGVAMSVVWTGIRPGRDGNPRQGASEILDYFSLLYSHTQGSRWLDLGPSRPDLCDGTLRYKARWNAELHEGFIKPRDIHWAILQPKPSFAELLMQHAFVTRTGSELTGTLVTDASASQPEELQTLIDRCAVPGLEHYRIAFLGKDSQPELGFTAQADRRVKLLAAGNVGQLIATYPNRDRVT